MAADGVFYGLFIRDAVNRTRSFDLNADSFKAPICSNTYTPDATTHDEYVDITNELSGGGYTSTGQTLDSVTSANSSNYWVFDATDEAYTGLTTTTARQSPIYDDTITGDGLVVNSDYGGDVSVTAGTLTVAWHANGIGRILFVPA